MSKNNEKNWEVLSLNLKREVSLDCCSCLYFFYLRKRRLIPKYLNEKGCYKK